MADKPHPLLKAAAIAAIPEAEHVHKLNPNAVRYSRPLADTVGMKDVGVHLVRLAPGGRSSEFHAHQHDEEFVYVLAGKGIAEIGDEEFAVGPGDFMGFVAGSLPHGVRNAGDDDFVFLVGGNRPAYDRADYPRIRKSRFRVNGVGSYISWDALSESERPDGKR